MTIVSGIEGINPPIAIMPYLKYIFPRHKPKVVDDTISTDILKFIDKPWAKGAALMTFGNERQPS
jgi:hypothetical protein